jgi:hypothetical protein
LKQFIPGSVPPAFLANPFLPEPLLSESFHLRLQSTR